MLPIHGAPRNVRYGSMLSIKALREAPNGDSVC
jgi:hypothetical protein